MLYKYKYKTFKKLAKMCAPPNTSIAKITIYSGDYYIYGNYSDKNKIFIWLTRNRKDYPYLFKGNKKKGYLFIGKLSKRQALIFVLAHELRHRWQFENNKYIGIKYDKRAERDADLWAIKILKKFRSNNG